jgi:hypothetical protein
MHSPCVHMHSSMPLSARRIAMLHLPFSMLWLLPGIIATVSILMMNLVSPSDVQGDEYSGDEATTVSRTGDRGRRSSPINK